MPDEREREEEPRDVGPGIISPLANSFDARFLSLAASRSIDEPPSSSLLLLSLFVVSLSHVPRLALSCLSSWPSVEYGSDESWNFRLIRHANDGVVQHPVASTNACATIPPLSTFCRNLLADLHNNGHAPANSKLAERIR